MPLGTIPAVECLLAPIHRCCRVISHWLPPVSHDCSVRLRTKVVLIFLIRRAVQAGTAEMRFTWLSRAFVRTRSSITCQIQPPIAFWHSSHGKELDAQLRTSCGKHSTFGRCD
ncbi:hypothetical protein AcV7_005868 [Taiwanofungus camphoratus]|nr:hypothetical protein AcV7_005868 [Antrodia cinnamomea]